MKKLPVIVKLYPREIMEADLLKALKIDRNNLDKELLRQPGRYAWWASLYATVSNKVDFLQEKLERKEAKWFLYYSGQAVTRVRVSDIKYRLTMNPEIQLLRTKLRQWQASERFLKGAERSFQQRLSALQTVSANVRREWSAEPSSKREEEES